MKDRFEKMISIPLPEGAGEGLVARLTTFVQKCAFCAQVFAIKNHIYGDAIRYTGLRGATYELIGGVARLHHLVNKMAPADVSPQDGWHSAVEDTLTDILNYAAIGKMMLDDENIQGEF